MRAVSTPCNLEACTRYFSSQRRLVRLCFDVDAFIIYNERAETPSPSETVEDILRNLDHF
jgi:hypothetical protein